MGFFKKVSSSGGKSKSKQSIPKAKSVSSVGKRKPAAPNGKRKRPPTASKSNKVHAAKKPRKEVPNEEVSSSDEEEEEQQSSGGSDASDGEFEDNRADGFTAEDNQLLKTIKSVAHDEESDETDDVLDEIAEKPAPAIVQRRIADSTRFACADKSGKGVVSYRPHRFSPVCVAFSSDAKFILSCSKDGSVVKYDLEQGRVCKILKLSKNEEASVCHKGHVLCCAISPDDKYVATAGDDKLIKIWDFKKMELVKEFKAHRSTITSLVFRKTLSPTELFSGSADRSVKAWNLDEMGFVDTMYGHQDGIQQLDMLTRARVLSCGGQDRTLRLFKVAEESQLVFNGFAESISIDTVALINEDHFVSGSADGSIYLWSVFKKKPVCVVKQAHGLRAKEGNAPHWICSVAACSYTDLVASGSSDGILRLWKVGTDYKSLAVIDQFKLDGFINDIRFADDASRLVCAVGQEHRSGRWWRDAKAKNSIVVVPLLEQ